jgi:hypothetical protein
MQQPKRIALRVALSLDRETMSWVARCVDYDIAASGPTLRAAQMAFIGVFLTQLIADAQDGRAPLADVPPPPHEVAERFQAGQPLRDMPEVEIPADLVPPGFVLGAAFEEMRVCA